LEVGEGLRVEVERVGILTRRSLKHTLFYVKVGSTCILFFFFFLSLLLAHSSLVGASCEVMRDRDFGALGMRA
jgi:hypothetical protein